MSRLTIDIGTAGNSATGDSLRTAFNKVNTNFEELYATTPLSFPSQSGNDGKVLTTDGSSLGWTTLDVSDLTDNTNLLSAEALVSIGATPPASPTAGRLWYDTDGGRMYIYYDSQWVDANPR